MKRAILRPGQAISIGTTLQPLGAVWAPGAARSGKRGLWIVAVLLLALSAPGPGAAPAEAQTTPGNGGNVTLHGTPAKPSAGSGETCVQVQIQGQKPNPYDCLNQQLQQQVQGTSPNTPSVPLSATSPSNQVGTFNQQGLSQQYGQNLGKSVIPYRPPAPVFSNGLHP